MTRRMVVVLAVLHLPIVGASWCAPHPPTQQFRDRAAMPPSLEFPMGTDDLGRDLVSRLLHGSRLSLTAALVATATALAVAAAVASAGGLLGRGAGVCVSLLTDMSMAVPWVFLLLALRSALPLDLPAAPAFLVVSVLVGAVSWGTTARLCHGAIRLVMAQPYVLAARAAGASRLDVMTVHVAPVVVSVLMAQGLVLFPQFVLAEVALSFLGLGVPEPLPSLGALLGEARSLEVLQQQPWRLAPAGVLVLLLACYQRLVTSSGPQSN